MKKFTILATMFAALTFASCGGGKTEGEAENADSTAAAVDNTENTEESTMEETPAADSTATDSTAAPATEEAPAK